MNCLYEFIIYLYNLIFFFRYYKCDICSQPIFFSRKAQLSKHLRKTHPEIFSFNQSEYIAETEKLI